MRKSTLSESQIVGILREAESGVPVADLLRKHGVSKATFFKWRSKCGGASVSDVKRLREFEAKNAKLKRMYADLALENAAIKDGAAPTCDRANGHRSQLWGMSRELLKLSGSLVHDYATISDDSPSPNRASRARRAATSAGIS